MARHAHAAPHGGRVLSAGDHPVRPLLHGRRGEPGRARGACHRAVGRAWLGLGLGVGLGFSLGACEMYVGVKLDGKVCLAEDENPYEKKRRAEKKKTKKAMKKFARRAVDEAPVNA